MQTQERPVEQKIDPKKKYQLAAAPSDGSGVHWLHNSPEGVSSWIQLPFAADKQPTFLSMQQIAQLTPLPSFWRGMIKIGIMLLLPI